MTGTTGSFINDSNLGRCFGGLDLLGYSTRHIWLRVFFGSKT